jgi:hypothetical protein
LFSAAKSLHQRLWNHSEVDSQYTKKGIKCPPPWIEGSDYDVAVESDNLGYQTPHNKDKNKRLFIEVDASDIGWGACAYNS